MGRPQDFHEVSMRPMELWYLHGTSTGFPWEVLDGTSKLQ